MTNLSKLDHFQKFNIKKSFDVDIDALEEKYLQLQKEFHPDKLANKSEKEQVDLEHNSILINEAYEILLSPLKRSIYFLKMQGVDIENDSKRVNPDQETLISNLIMREAIFESETKKDLEEMRSICKMQLKEALKNTKAEFEKDNLSTSTQMLIKAKYLDKTLQEIKEKIGKL